MIRFVILYPFLVLTTQENNRQIIAVNIHRPLPAYQFSYYNQSNRIDPIKDSNLTSNQNKPQIPLNYLVLVYIKHKRISFQSFNLYNKIPSILFPHNRTARTTDELSAFLSKPLYHKSHRKIKPINQSPRSPFEMIQRNSTTCLEILNIDIPNSQLELEQGSIYACI